MPDLSLSQDDSRFIDDIASLLTPWGMPQVAARLYGYLLLSAEAVTLDQISEELGVSKSGASVAARLLEKHSLARRFGERGTKRVFYEASDSYGGVLMDQVSLLGSVARLLQNRAPQLTSDLSRERLNQASTFYLTVRDAMEAGVLDAMKAVEKGD
ncbi:GbsR/MarR family transcriptional regulator [Zhongshania sp.]|uniref:GbsR/MarR family transcriptional regulator n=1 Tax=Zhongshania sp. TaxID=1971902 RepID=UPI0035688825